MKEGGEFRSMNQKRMDSDLFDFDEGSYPHQQQQQQQFFNGQPNWVPISCHNNFLNEAGFTLYNQKDEVITFELPNHYSFFRVFLISQNSSVEQKYHLTDCNKIEAKNIRHPGISKEENE